MPMKLSYLALRSKRIPPRLPLLTLGSLNDYEDLRRFVRRVLRLHFVFLSDVLR
eukprot:m.889890 g.889890  ORF g.889890 m.889890 type:complete len:54 (+) comp59950_c0_seq1:6866-7027(+)